MSCIYEYIIRYVKRCLVSNNEHLNFFNGLLRGIVTFIPVKTSLMDQNSKSAQKSSSEIEVLSIEEFQDFGSEWNSLLAESKVDNLFLTHEWISTWIKYFSADSEFFILIARDPKTNELLGIAPLMIEKVRYAFGFSLKRLVLMGNGCLEVDHLDFIIKHGLEINVSDSFVSYIQQHKHKWDVVFFDGLVSSSQVLTSLLRNDFTWGRRIYMQPCPYLPLPDSWDFLKQSFGKNLRYNLGRYKRKLEKSYPEAIKFQCVETNDELQLVMPRLYSLHHLIRKSKNELGGIFEDEKIASFHNEMSETSLSSGRLKLYSLCVEDAIIAALYCFRYKNSVLFYQTGYDPEWQRYSPGRLLMAHAIEDSISQKATEFDFLRGGEAYKESWTKEIREEFRVYAASSLKGYLFLMPRLIRTKARALLRRINSSA